MGNIKKILSEKEIDSEGLYVGCTLEDCTKDEDCFHLHWDIFRLLFSERDFLSFIDKIKKAEKNIKEDNKTGTYLANFKPQDRFFKNRLVIEEQDKPNDGVIHIHIRDLRLEMGKKEFMEIAECMNKAYQKLLSNM